MHDHPPETISGFLVINKPSGPTSFDCIRHFKKILGRSVRIGHGGTLDPFAEGILIVGFGKEATRALAAISQASKTYRATAKLGELRDTGDLTGTLISTTSVPQISPNDLQKALNQLMPSYEQIPPQYSALKYRGRPLHELARRKVLSEKDLEHIVAQKKRLVHIYAGTITTVDSPFFSFEVSVSKGTYIRSLANDIARQCGLTATTYSLVRIAVGTITLSDAIPFSTLINKEMITQHLIKKWPKII